MKSLRKAVLWMIHRAGYDLVRPDPQPRGFIPSHLSTIATPRTVIDVGVASGTPALYEAFPKAHFLLVEPLRVYADSIDQILRTYDATVVYKAVGSAVGQAEFTVDLVDPEKSSFETRSSTTSRGHAVAKEVVEITTLDTLLAENPGMEEPIFLKLDTEGHELEALRGGCELLKRTEIVVAEVSVARRFEGGYCFEDVILFMREHGFRLLDILSIAHARGEPEPRHMDVVFKRAG